MNTRDEVFLSVTFHDDDGHSTKITDMATARQMIEQLHSYKFGFKLVELEIGKNFESNDPAHNENILKQIEKESEEIYQLLADGAKKAAAKSLKIRAVEFAAYGAYLVGAEKTKSRLVKILEANTDRPGAIAPKLTLIAGGPTPSGFRLGDKVLEVTAPNGRASIEVCIRAATPPHVGEHHSIVIPKPPAGSRSRPQP